MRRSRVGIEVGAHEDQASVLSAPPPIQPAAVPPESCAQRQRTALQCDRRAWSACALASTRDTPGAVLRAVLRPGELTFPYDSANRDVAGTKKSFDDDLTTIKEWLGCRPVRSRNTRASLEDRVRSAVIARRAELSKTQSDLQALGIPSKGPKDQLPPRLNPMEALGPEFNHTSRIEVCSQKRPPGKGWREVAHCDHQTWIDRFAEVLDPLFSATTSINESIASSYNLIKLCMNPGWQENLTDLVGMVHQTEFP